MKEKKKNFAAASAFAVVVVATAAVAIPNARVIFLVGNFPRFCLPFFLNSFSFHGQNNAHTHTFYITLFVGYLYRVCCVFYFFFHHHHLDSFSHWFASAAFIKLRIVEYAPYYI